MTDNTQTAAIAASQLSLRALQCKAFRWIPGMSLGDGFRFDYADDQDDAVGRLPELSDPATLGCIEHGLLPACGYNDAHLDAGADRAGDVLFYVVYRPDPLSFPSKWLSACEDGSATKAEALVAALEAAP